MFAFALGCKCTNYRFRVAGCVWVEVDSGTRQLRMIVEQFWDGRMLGQRNRIRGNAGNHRVRNVGGAKGGPRSGERSGEESALGRLTTCPAIQ